MKLGADIDLSGIEWTPIGKLDASTDFKGEFNGDGKTTQCAECRRAMGKIKN